MVWAAHVAVLYVELLEVLVPLFLVGQGLADVFAFPDVESRVLFQDAHFFRLFFELLLGGLQKALGFLALDLDFPQLGLEILLRLFYHG